MSNLDILCLQSANLLRKMPLTASLGTSDKHADFHDRVVVIYWIHDGHWIHEIFCSICSLFCGGRCVQGQILIVWFCRCLRDGTQYECK